MEEASKEVINYVYKFIDWISNLKIEALQEQYKFIDKVPEEKITGIFKKNTIPQAINDLCNMYFQGENSSTT